MKISGIYQIQSKIKPERIYIGSAVDINDRWRCHLKDLKYNKHGNKKLQRHYDKYGIADFVFNIIYICNKEYLIAKEQFFIDIYNPYFNCCKIVGSRLGVKATKETLVRMSKAAKGNKIWLGKHHSEESKKKIGIKSKGRIPWNKGKRGIYSCETIKKISIAAKKQYELHPMVFTDEIREKIRKAKKGNQGRLGQVHLESTKQKMKDAWDKRKLNKIA